MAKAMADQKKTTLDVKPIGPCSKGQVVDGVFSSAAGRSHLGTSSGSLWFGVKRTEECMKSGLTETCTALNSFRWTDNSATGTSGFIWTEGQPSNYAGEQDCAILTVGPNEQVSNLDVGAFDNVGCEIRYNGTNRAIKGYVCGKKPMN